MREKKPNLVGRMGKFVEKKGTKGSLPGLVTADERFSAVRSFLETEVLNLKRLDPNNLERKLPSWSFCFDFFCSTSSLTVSWTLLVFTEAALLL